MPVTAVIQILKIQKKILELSFFIPLHKKEIAWNGSTGPGQIQQFLLLECNLIIILSRN